MSERFWRWLHAFCERRIKEIYLRDGVDLKCPHCKMWASIAGIKRTSWNNKQTRYECQHCFTETAWEFHGPVAVSVPIEYFPDLKVKP